MGKRKRRTISEDLLAETKDRRPSISDTVCSYQLSDNVGLWHRRSTKKPDPSTKKLDPSTKRLDPSTKILDPSTKRLDPSTKILDPSTKRLDPSTKRLDPSATSRVHCTAPESPLPKKSPNLPQVQQKVRKHKNDRRSVFASNLQCSKDSRNRRAMQAKDLRNRRATQAKAKNGIASNGRKKPDSLPSSKVRLKLPEKNESSDSGDSDESLVSDDDGSTSGSSDNNSRKAQRNRSNKKRNGKVRGES